MKEESTRDPDKLTVKWFELPKEKDVSLIAYAEEIGVPVEQVHRITPEEKKAFCYLCRNPHCENCFIVEY